MPGTPIEIHRSLTEQIMLGGAPRTIALLNGTLGAALGLGLHSPTAVPLCVLLHVLAVRAAKKDPQFFDAFKRQLRQKKIYHV